jgi:hypothetical protein
MSLFPPNLIPLYAGFHVLLDMALVFRRAAVALHLGGWRAGPRGALASRRAHRFRFLLLLAHGGRGARVVRTAAVRRAVVALLLKPPGWVSYQCFSEHHVIRDYSSGRLIYHPGF